MKEADPAMLGELQALKAEIKKIWTQSPNPNQQKKSRGSDSTKKKKDMSKACTVYHKCITLSVMYLQLAHYLSGDLDSLGLADTKEEHRNQINQVHRPYIHTHMTCPPLETAKIEGFIMRDPPMQGPSLEAACLNIRFNRYNLVPTSTSPPRWSI